MDVSAYLHRIGLSVEDVTHSYEFLCRLQQAHIFCVPYENLDIVSGVPLSLEPDDIFDKVVGKGRGGYCFELNCLYAHLLEELGFRVRSFLGRFLRGVEGVPVRRHRLIGVECEGNTYVCDVGLGQSAPRQPLVLKEHLVQEVCGEKYKFVRDELLGWVLYDLHQGEWRRYYSFTEDPQVEVDFLLPSFYCEKHPESPFNKGVMVAIKTPTGRKAINGADFKIFEQGENEQLVHVEENISRERLVALLKSEFGIVWSEAESVTMGG